MVKLRVLPLSAKEFKVFSERLEKQIQTFSNIEYSGNLEELLEILMLTLRHILQLIGLSGLIVFA